MDIVKIETVKPVVKTVTVTLSKVEISDLVSCYERYFGTSTFTNKLKKAAAGEIGADLVAAAF